jgi:hypothetical protein
MSERVTCPHCHQEVELAETCSNCGQPLQADLQTVGDEPFASSSTSETPIADSAEPTLEPTSEEQVEVVAEPEIEPDQLEEEPMSAQQETVEGIEEPAVAATAGESTSKTGFSRPDMPSFAEAIARIRQFFSFSGNRPEDYWRIAATGLVLVLIAMLADSAGLAILIGLFIVPVLILRYLSAIDLFEREPWWGIGGAAAAGLLGGLIVGGIGHFLVDRLWIENAPLRVGAAGFGGNAAENAGSAPFSVLFLCGLILPALAEVVKLATPVFMRQWPEFRNEVMDGITLGAAAGGAFAAGTAIVHFWPVITRGDSVGVGLSEWTGMLLGLAVVRPLIQMATTALLGAALWQYSLKQSSEGLILPVAAGAGGAIFYGLSDIVVQPIGTTFELFWSVLVAAVLLYFLRIVIRQALAQDAQALGLNGQRVICGNCGRVTPVGAFCAICGAPLGKAPAAPATPALTGTQSTSA